MMLLLLAAVLCFGQTPQASVALEAPARVGLPIWLKISAPDEIRYPFYTAPDWHVCHDIEVRKDGKPFPRIQRLGSAGGTGECLSPGRYAAVCIFLANPSIRAAFRCM